MSELGAPAPVPALELGAYLGRWYEIARLPTRVEPADVRGVVAEYYRGERGRILVRNRARLPSGRELEARGVAWQPDPSQPGKLRVRFFWPFAGDYWILGLGPLGAEGYRWAVVGEPRRRSLWILGRAPRLQLAELRQALRIAEAQGYDLRPLIYTPQP